VKQWFQSRERREQRALIVAAAAMAAFALYAFLWQPLSRDVGQLRSRVADQRQTLAWMKRTAVRVQRLRANAAHASVPTNTQPLLSLADSTARKAGLHDVIRRLEPQGDTRVQLWLENAQFDTLIRWLAKLRATRAVTVANGSIQLDAKPGMVNAHLLLEQPSAK
jgi:general secretion pathway protein M